MRQPHGGCRQKGYANEDHCLEYQAVEVGGRKLSGPPFCIGRKIGKQGMAGISAHASKQKCPLTIRVRVS